MSTPKVYATVPAAWTNVIGAAASVAGVTWQNVGGQPIQIAFTTSAPAGGSTDAIHTLNIGDGYYDKNGSAACWARSVGNGGTSLISGTAD